jgi:hypothetical protein
MRKKVVTYDGDSYTITPLTLEQVEAYWKGPAPQEGVAPEDRALRHTIETVVAPSLNNARDGEGQPWDYASVRAKMDPMLIFRLLAVDILKFTGVFREPKPGEASGAPGEAPATSDSSATSGVASSSRE